MEPALGGGLRVAQQLVPLYFRWDLFAVATLPLSRDIVFRTAVGVVKTSGPEAVPANHERLDREAAVARVAEVALFCTACRCEPGVFEAFFIFCCRLTASVSAECR